jgi:hypothetical protein
MKYAGRKFAHPLLICIRLLVFPILQVGNCLTFIAVLIGWGLDEAVQVWADRP